MRKSLRREPGWWEESICNKGVCIWGVNKGPIVEAREGFVNGKDSLIEAQNGWKVKV